MGEGVRFSGQFPGMRLMGRLFTAGALDLGGGEDVPSGNLEGDGHGDGSPASDPQGLDAGRSVEGFVDAFATAALGVFASPTGGFLQRAAAVEGGAGGRRFGLLLGAESGPGFAASGCKEDHATGVALINVALAAVGGVG